MNLRLMAVLLVLLVGALPSSARVAAVAAAQPCALVPVPGAPGSFTAVPPAGFDPLTASAADLRCYGFPRRPSDPQLVAAWQTVVSRAKQYVFPVVDTSGPTAEPPAISSPLTSPGPDSTIQVNNNATYAGYRVPTSQPSGTVNWSDASMQWVQPSVTFTNTEEGLQIWTAVGAPGFPQCGARRIWDQTYPHFFYETTSDKGAVTVFSPAVSVGDTLFAETTMYTTAPTANFFFENASTGQYAALYENITYGTGQTWFSLELYPNSGGYPHFQNFGVQLATTANASGSKNNYINYFNNIQDDIWRNNVLYVQTGSLDSYGDFSLTSW